MTIYELILAGLKTKFQGVEDATLQRIASKKSEGVTDEDKVNSIVEGIGFQTVLESYGDYRADGAAKTAKKNAIADYEKQYGLKDGKSVTPPPPPVVENQNKQPEQKNELTLEAITKLMTEGFAKALEPINAKFAQMDEEKQKAQFDAKVDAVAKGFQIPSFAYKGKAIPEDTDLNKYFTDLKQEMINDGYKFASSPQQSSQVKPEDEGKDIASIIEQGTQELNKK